MRHLIKPSIIQLGQRGEWGNGKRKRAYMTPRKARSGSLTPSSACHFCLHQRRKDSMVVQVSVVQMRRP